ncbi:hypothetical protein AMJ44_06195 [candidate division WOR-1 bacterium DG_54_3]|uniref:Uncharacterized protein n=1 Tax=candidate division WOR-1 bacterium DG_54_3 TaxID=1703775 RepID=A0A0S7Y2B7_UNCSA|nr:MAG: hypothetical protein AMJ44_06195 [candidate division WOR-1 bacterium DG_54_3]
MSIELNIIAGIPRQGSREFDPGMAKELKFEDKNKNGVIERSSQENDWQEEGYKSYIDINQDGKILEAEAKYYLGKYALEDDEKFIILSYRLGNLSKVRDALEKSHLLREMTLEILEAGLTPGRLLRLFVLEAKIIPTIAHPRMQGILLRFLVSKAMGADLNSDQRELFLSKAAETALAFKDSREKNKTLSRIAKVIMERGSAVQWLKIFNFFDIF